MNKPGIVALKGLRKIYSKVFSGAEKVRPVANRSPQSVADVIYTALTSDKPCMIARFGSTEMSCICNYLGITRQQGQVFNYIKGNTFAWWWEQGIINQMQQWSGLFPATEEKARQFSELMLNDIPLVDILGSWLPEEKYFDNQMKNAERVRFVLLDPYWAEQPWTRALAGKKVLVVHPFADTIESQYKKRQLLFKNNLLPEFELRTVKAVQSIAGVKTNYADWFEALDYMKREIDKVDYDICLIGAGAYGFPLAAHVKRSGKKGFQMGGSLQLLFGIKGKRWSKDYSADYDYSTLPNEHWRAPGENEKPVGAEKVEGACYW